MQADQCRTATTKPGAKRFDNCLKAVRSRRNRQSPTRSRYRASLLPNPSVSRDLKEIGAIKTKRGYELPDSEADGDAMHDVAGLLRTLSPAGPNLLVIRTGIGAAQRVALALDRTNWPEVVGNIGGDDTVFVATATATAQKKLIAKIDHAIRN